MYKLLYVLIYYPTVLVVFLVGISRNSFVCRYPTFVPTDTHVGYIDYSFIVGDDHKGLSASVSETTNLLYRSSN